MAGNSNKPAPFDTGSLDTEAFRGVVTSAPLAVYDGKDNSWTAIPASFRPLVVRDDVWRQTADDCARVLGSMYKVCAWLRQPSQTALASRLFGHLTGVEHDAAFGYLRDTTTLATVRFDFFFAGDDLRILEVNTTIPAMQAYSDMVRTAWAAGLPPDRRRQLPPPANGADLLSSLLLQYEHAGGRRQKPRIAIVARTGDSQLAELRWLQRQWQQAGHEVLLLAPLDLQLHGTDLRAGDIPIDLVYRHIFAYRLDQASDFAKALRESRRYRIFNPVSAHLEVKGLLGETSRLADDEQLAGQVGLSPDEIAAVRRRVPWTRLVTGAGPDVAREMGERGRDALVLKTSSGYGGHGVVIGARFEEQDTQEQVARIMGVQGRVRWEDFCTFTARGSGGIWVVQERISGRQVSHRYLSRRGDVQAAESYVDCSMFGGLFPPGHIPGGASRFSEDPVVNIGRGGGLMPLILQSEAGRAGLIF